MSKIFLSHNSKDKPFIRKLAADLRSYSHVVWLDEQDILIGDSITDKIGEGLADSDYVIVALSSDSVNSSWVNREIQVATNREINEGKTILLPILIENISLPTILRDKLYLDFTTEDVYQKSFKKLIEAIPDSSPIIEKVSSKELSQLNEKIENLQRIIEDNVRGNRNTDVGSFNRKSQELLDRIKEEGKSHPEYTPINLVYAFQIESIYITLGYVLHSISKYNLKGAHQLTALLSMHDKWQEVDVMLTAYTDMIESSKKIQKISLEKSNKHNYLGIISLGVAVVVLLFGNNLCGRIDSNKNSSDADEAIPEKSVVVYDEVVKNDDLNENAIDRIDSLLKSGEVNLAIELIDENIELATRKDLKESLTERKNSVYIILEKNVDNAFTYFPGPSILVEKNGLYGLIDSNGNFKTQIEYDEIDPVYAYPLLITKKDKNYGFLSKYGDIIWKTIFSDIDPQYFDPLIMIRDNGKYGFIDSTGTYVFEPLYDDIYHRYGDLIKVKKGERWGFININGEVATKIEYDTIMDVRGSGSLFIGEIGGKRFFLDSLGKITKNPGLE